MANAKFNYTTVNAVEMSSTERATVIGEAWDARDSLKDTINALIKVEHEYRKKNKISVGRAQPTAKQPADPFFVALITAIRTAREKAKKTPWTDKSTTVYLSRVRKALLNGTDLVTEQRADKTGARTGGNNDAEIPATAGAVKTGRGQVVTVTIPKGMSATDVAAGVINALAASEEYASLAEFLKPQVARFIGQSKK